MKAYTASCLIGITAVDEKGKLLASKLFENNPAGLAGKLSAISSGTLEEEDNIRKDLQSKGFDSSDISEANPARQYALDNLRSLAKKGGFAESDEALNAIISNACEIFSASRASRGREAILPHAVGVYDELNKELNEFSERLREWYGIEDIETVMAVKSHEELARKIFEERESAVFKEEDMKAIAMFSKAVATLFETRKYLESYISGLEKEMMPTLAAVAGSILASRLVAEAGGIEKLARMPSSRVQLLGAEKALFRHLRQKSKAPKYGIIFSHRYVQQASPDKRGKVARLVAAKISLAAKIDFFSKADRGKEMQAELEKKMKNIVG
ncbi:MAG: hypothetical protein HYX24_01010 [Candidatus Aenigmarchaeota archaeon]|nr:hypothetical protein [Candidatus Aenigmarchaeota archaeon]